MHSKTKIIGLSLITFLGLATAVEAGRIGPVQDQVPPSHSSGFGGWDISSTSNVKVKITDLDYNEDTSRTFDVDTGTYPAMVEGDSFESDIYEAGSQSGEVLVHLHGKDWPVGEPAGIKVMNATDASATLSHNKPASCIMTTSYFDVDPDEDLSGDLSKTNPTETQCSSAFQSHKRFKLNMLPSMIGSAQPGEYLEKGVDLIFNVEVEEGTRRYQILQKANNYTDVRLDGYKVEVGFIDAVGNFTTASSAGADLRFSIGQGEQDDGSDIWLENELATFSHGLWGAADGDHFPNNGFFDNDSAGYVVVLADTNDTISSTATLGSTYVALPVPNGDPVVTQFGQWLPSKWAPEGIFWDDDNDPAADAVIMAFWGDTGGDIGDGTTFAWMKGNDDGFQVATAADLFGWASSPIYEVGEIEDVLNLGLNYIVEVGDISTFPDFNNSSLEHATFTIRLTPHVATQVDEPGYVTNHPPKMTDYLSSEGAVQVSPTPEFIIGDSLALVVADLDLNNTLTTEVNVSINGTWSVITLDEVAGRSVFTSALTTVAGDTAGIAGSVVTVQEGSVVTVTYIDASDGSGGINVPVTAITTATVTPVDPEEPVDPTDPTDRPTYVEDDKGIFSTMDNVSLFVMIFGFLAIGGLIARKKLAK